MSPLGRTGYGRDVDYRLRPLSTVCSATGQPLVPGSTCVSVLVEEDGRFQRYDYAEEVWEASEACLGFWRREVPQPEAKAKTLDADTLIERLEQLAEEDVPAQAPLAFVMALWLMRRRRLRLDGSETVDGIPRLVLSGSAGEGPFSIRDQQLSAADSEALLAALFDDEDSGDEGSGDETSTASPATATFQGAA